MDMTVITTHLQPSKCTACAAHGTRLFGIRSMRYALTSLKDFRSPTGISNCLCVTTSSPMASSPYTWPGADDTALWQFNGVGLGSAVTE